MRRLIIILCLSLYGVVAASQEKSYRIVFYNVENIFDIIDDPLTADEEFTPGGFRHWTAERYGEKLHRIAQVLDSAGGKALPAFIGLAEVENRKVLDDLARQTLLEKENYACVHYDSPDARGIDVAFLYRKDCFRVLNTAPLPIVLPEDTTFKTRDVLYVSGLLGTDTLHFFVCHFPSMREGEEETEWRRIGVAAAIRSKVDSLLSLNRESLIVIMGDMNGKADTEAQKRLGTMDSAGPLIGGTLYNTGYYWLHEELGAYRYRGKWQTLDHIIVSGALLEGKQGVRAGRHMGIYSASFMLEEDTVHLGYKPMPTYRGPRYVGGYSDHLPVFLDLYKR